MQFAFPCPVTLHKSRLKANVTEICVNERITYAFVWLAERQDNSSSLLIVLYNTSSNCTDIITRHPTQKAVKSYGSL
jgi:hypothetical protein